MAEYKIIRKIFTDIQEQAYEILIDQLYDHGVEGVEIIAPWSREELAKVDKDFIDIPENPNQVEIKAYIPREALIANEGRIRNILGEYTVLEVEPEEKWLLAYQDYFKPLRVGKHFVIVPAWEKYQAELGDQIITIDPGIAFGTGSHPTTKNVLVLMENHSFNHRKVADIGAGSGILTKGALLLGAKDVLVIDIDDKALEVSKENLKEYQNIRFLKNNLLENCEESFDIILANIVADAILALGPQMKKGLEKHGLLLVSGIIEARWDEVQVGLENQGLKLLEKILEEGWVAATFQKVEQ